MVRIFKQKLLIYTTRVHYYSRNEEVKITMIDLSFLVYGSPSKFNFIIFYLQAEILLENTYTILYGIGHHKNCIHLLKVNHKCMKF